jgi:hypothetical protein
MPVMFPGESALKATPNWTRLVSELGLLVGPSTSSNSVHGQTPGAAGGFAVVNDHWAGAAMPTPVLAIAATVAVYCVELASGWFGMNVAVLLDES